MTETEVQRVIYVAITECRDHNGQSFVQYIDTARELSTAVLHALRMTGLVKLDDCDY
jgi:hypothetical protein